MSSFEIESDENIIKERYCLVSSRIREIASDPGKGDACREFFYDASQLLSVISDILEKSVSGGFSPSDGGYLKAVNGRLYRDLKPENYGSSWADPRYAEKSHESFGPYFSALYAHLISCIPAAYRGDIRSVTLAEELFSQVHALFGGELPKEGLLREALYYHFSDNFRDAYEEHLLTDLIKGDAHMARCVSESAEDPGAVFRTGAFADEEACRRAEHYAALTEDELQETAESAAADALHCFEGCGASGSRIAVSFTPGSERAAAAAAGKLSDEGFDVIFSSVRTADPWYRPAEEYGGAAGLSGTMGRAYSDHIPDPAILADRNFASVRLESMENVLERYEEELRQYAGCLIINAGPGAASVDTVPAARKERGMKIMKELSASSAGLLKRYAADITCVLNL